ncbi:Hsp20/alpha crystallin family protein [Algiphilus sp.]|uniref:Hsp20/alpha crystallin family protein n=2 Tax=Algiphilus sp. TaxID=1872431 RepID=UPI0025B923F8|nr:Hsp20/alpha crystallin family protein [Algiphilus sp.]MCK5768975.1 Hsp20/alpha crystallin family protein [Algiphilus sp.]
MSVMRYEPWSLHRDLWQEMSRALDRMQSDDASSGATADWVPPVDIEEDKERFVLYADVPGVDPASIEVTLENGVLTLSGAREGHVEQDKAERRRVERAHGRFYRRFTLPDTADADNVSARGNNGVLEVVIPKRASTQPRRIAVAA